MKQRQKWILAGLAPLAAGAAWWASRVISRRRKPERARYLTEPPRAYELDDEPGTTAGKQYRTQIPVTAPKRAQDRTGGPRRGTAKVYEAPPTAALSAGDPGSEEGRKFPWLLALIPLLILAGFTIFALMGQPQARAQVPAVPGGDAESGRQAIRSWGCGSCHTVPGVPGAYGKVGPRLDQMAEQTYIAGMLPNTPENLVRWIMMPQEIQPGNAMPNTGVTETMARNMAAYLYSLR